MECYANILHIQYILYEQKIWTLRELLNSIPYECTEQNTSERFVFEEITRISKKLIDTKKHSYLMNSTYEYMLIISLKYSHLGLLCAASQNFDHVHIIEITILMLVKEDDYKWMSQNSVTQI